MISVNVIVINSGSSTLKFSLIETSTGKKIASGLFDRIGLAESYYKINNFYRNVLIKNHEEAINILFNELLNLGIVSSLSDIEAVGHRVVQGMDIFKTSTIITDDVIKELEKIREVDPLHNPANVLGIKLFKKLGVPMVAVFDTTFHQSISENAYLYPVPYEWYEKYGVRKYGAHGISHEFIAKQVQMIYHRSDLRIISCHIGSGASITAIKNGKSVDTSMGFTPLSGVMMSTRSGDIDPSIIPFIMEKEHLSINEVMNDLNKKSGLLGLSGISSDMRDILKASLDGNKRATLALDKYIRRITDYIASYYVLLGGIDVLVFTAGVGENSPEIRRLVCEKLECLGALLDDKVNENSLKFTKISSKKSKFDIYDIDTDEELMIALETEKMIKF